MKTYQFRLYPTKSQAKSILKQLEVHKTLYNHCLEIKIKAYKDENKNLSCFDLIKSEIPSFKGQSNYSSMQQTLRRLDKTYKNFFKGGGFPRFKKFFKTISYARIGDGCKIHPNYIYLQFVGKVRINKPKNLENIKALSITYKHNKFYVNIACETFVGIAPQRNSKIGIDFGIKNTIITSSGEQIKTPEFYKLKQKEIAKLSRKKNYKGLQKVHEKIQNRRKDYNHKLSRQIVDKYDVICLEKLSIESIKSFKHVNKRLYDIGINQLINYITYKAESAGKLVVMVDPAYTTQECHNCQKLNKLSLNERIYSCECGYIEDRDVNAAQNILTRGLASLAKA